MRVHTCVFELGINFLLEWHRCICIDKTNASTGQFCTTFTAVMSRYSCMHDMYRRMFTSRSYIVDFAEFFIDFHLIDIYRPVYMLFSCSLRCTCIKAFNIEIGLFNLRERCLKKETILPACLMMSSLFSL